jgi:hypothetical protein
VRFYDDPQKLCGSVADFLADGLAATQPIVLIATKSHRELLLNELRRRGFAVDRLVESVDIAVLDAQETLDRFMDDGQPDQRRFSAVIGDALSSVSRAREDCTVRAYGEMVDVLWRGGNREGAIRLEVLWNDLAGRYPFSLLCGYAMGHFYKQAGDFERVCGLHTHQHPADERSA